MTLARRDMAVRTTAGRCCGCADGGAPDAMIYYLGRASRFPDPMQGPIGIAKYPEFYG